MNLSIYSYDYKHDSIQNKNCIVLEGLNQHWDDDIMFKDVECQSTWCARCYCHAMINGFTLSVQTNAAEAC